MLFNHYEKKGSRIVPTSTSCTVSEVGWETVTFILLSVRVLSVLFFFDNSKTAS